MSEQHFTLPSSLPDLLLDAICVVDREGRFVFVSAAGERIFGYPVAEMIGRRMIELVHPDDRARTLQAAEAIMAGRLQPSFENRYLRKDGSVAHILWSARWSEQDQVRVAVAHDISERKRTEARQQALYAIAEAAQQTDDLSALFQQVHRILARLLPVSHLSVLLRDDSAPQPCLAYAADASDAPAAAVTAPSAEALERARSLLLGAEWPTPPDRDPPGWLCVPLGIGGRVLGVMLLRGNGGEAGTGDRELLQFVSTQIATAVERQRMLARLTFMAQHDPLTRLPNRALLHDRLHNALARARRERTHLALLFLDLDKFKQINDSLGHASGDRLLQQVAERVRQCLREVDTVARFGGDEFVVLLEDFHGIEHASQVADRIRQTLSQPFDLQGQHLRVLSSIGVALYPLHAEDAQELLRQADLAMYLAKQDGGDRFQLGTPAPRRPDSL